MSRQALKAAVLGAIIALAGASGIAASGEAAPIDPYLLDVANGDVAASPVSDAAVNADGRSRAAGYAVRCLGNIQDPHYSSGAGGAIAKVDVTCTGSGVASVTVRTRGLLTFAPSSSASNTNVVFGTRATSDQSQTITVNGPAKTFYLPQVGSNGGRGTGFWRATLTWQITSLPNATVGSQTKTVWKAI